MKPSPFMAAVDPTLEYSPARHVACGAEFVCKHMSPAADEIQAITAGVGMPDRATEAWVCLPVSALPKLANRLSMLNLLSLRPGEGASGGLAIGDGWAVVNFNLYVDADRFWLSFPRSELELVLRFLRGTLQDQSVGIEDQTGRVARIALMGPHAKRLFAVLEFPESDSLRVGQHIVIQVLDEPVRVCRSDFAGPLGYDLIMDRGPFNLILAVFCAWAVRLQLRLLPVGLAAVEHVQQNRSANGVER